MTGLHRGGPGRMGAAAASCLALLALPALLPGCVAPIPPEAEEAGIYEEMPAWRMPELAVTDLNVEPRVLAPGQPATARAIISNIGAGPTPAGTLRFTLDGNEIAKLDLGRLEPGATLARETRLSNHASGMHVLRATLDLPADAFDGNSANDSQARQILVTDQPGQAWLELEPTEFAAAPPRAGAPYELTVPVRNLGDAPSPPTGARVFLDGEPVGRATLGPVAPGETARLSARLPRMTPGEHIVSMMFGAGPSDDGNAAFAASLPPLKTWHLVVPDRTRLLDIVAKDHWRSLGPEILQNDWIGRVNAIVFDPSDQDVFYVGGFGHDAGIAAAPGIWKTTDGGDGWTPVGDKLPTMLVGAMAVDPANPKIVYAGTDHGIFKSIDGGTTWHNFATSWVVGRIGRFAVRSTGSGGVLLYAAGNAGLWRYVGSDPKATTSSLADWIRIKAGHVRDFALHPSDDATLFAAVQGDGFYRTAKGLTATPGSESADWTNLKEGLPKVDGSNLLSIDVFRSNPDVLFAGVTRPQTGIYFSLYRSENGGETWTTAKDYLDGELDGGIYNPFVRISPRIEPASLVSGAAPKPWLVYFGGVRLYQWIAAPTKPGGSQTAQVPSVAFDLKAVEFPSWGLGYTYFALGDQGVFRCKTVVTPKQAQLPAKKFGLSGDQCTHRNKGLGVAEFYHLASSRTNPKLMLAGTQDTGTVVYEGSPIWRKLPPGDGMYSAINADGTKPVFYIQYQSLDSTGRSDDGGVTWSPVGQSLPKGYGFDGGFMTPDLGVTDGLLAAGGGEQVYHTDNGGKSWSKEGPAVERGKITRIAVNPSTHAWIAGTSAGELFYRANGGAWIAAPIFEHPNGAKVESLAFSTVDPTILYATFRIGWALPEAGRVYRFTIDASDPAGKLVSTPLGQGFPSNLQPRVIAGDPHAANVAYAGTDHGVFRFEPTAAGGPAPWQPYNKGLPLTTVVSLLVAPDKTLRAGTKGRGAWEVLTGP